MANPHPLLAPLSREQQRLVDVVADAFRSEDYQWPFFDFVEGVLDNDDLDAMEVLQSFPTIGGWGYGALAWNRNNSAEAEVALTVVGMSHTPALRQYVPVFFELVNYLVARRKEFAPEPRRVRNLTVTGDEFRDYWLSSRRLSVPSRLVGQLKEHEPPLRFGGGGLQPDGSWIAGVGRQLSPFAGLATIDDYVARLDDLISTPPPSLPPILPSPLGLAAALDFLNAMWQLTHDGERLFAFASAERTTRLAFDVQTADEFAAHLSAFADILRAANKRLHAEPKRRDRDRPLARLDADLAMHLDADARTRTAAACRTLEWIIMLRDAEQHGVAREHAIEGFRELGVRYPTSDWNASWKTVSARAIGALNSIREELSSTGIG